MSESHSESAAGGARRPGVHQPVRAAVAGVELIALVGCALLAYWLWSRGVVSVPAVDSVRVPRLFGNWLVASVAVATVGGLLLMDMLRQCALAVRVRG